MPPTTSHTTLATANPNPLTIMFIAAHPDDCEFHAGGTAVRWRTRGDRVIFVTTTNGDAGHHQIAGADLARRRCAEADKAASLIGAESIIFDHHDGELIPTLETRKALIRLIRQYHPDLVLTHRPNDYHPDHRYTSILVQDAAYLLTVPSLCADTTAMADDPVIAYMQDPFQKPLPHAADVVVPVDDVFDRKLQMIHCHRSQVYEWLPWHDGLVDSVPQNDADRLAWLRRRLEPRFTSEREHGQNRLLAQFGADAAANIRYTEAFEFCEYGRTADPNEIPSLFPIELPQPA